jgi:uncharacterized membrane protein
VFTLLACGVGLPCFIYFNSYQAKPATSEHEMLLVKCMMNLLLDIICFDRVLKQLCQYHDAKEEKLKCFDHGPWLNL